MTVRDKPPKRHSQALNDSRPLLTGEARPRYLVPNYDVFEAALDRIRWLFEEFDGRVMVCNSGGKDSTVVLELAAMVARERGEKLHVQWLDQETEFEATVDYQRYIMYERDDIEFHWYQIPFLLENSSNQTNPWLKVWDPEHPEEWVREKEPGSIQENVYGQVYFYDVLSAINSIDWDGCLLDGIRIEESPARRLTCTTRPMYKWATWSVVDCAPQMVADKTKHRYRFHPIYDWRYWDVWKAIHDNGWKYNAHYDHMHRYGVKTSKMRVSNYHHESALASLLFLQEIEPQTWAAATRRLAGISTYGHLGKEQYPTTLPYMFKSWNEYMVHLIENLAPPEARPTFYNHYRRLKKACPWDSDDELSRQVLNTVIGNDLYGTHINNYIVTSRGRQHARVARGEVAG